MWVTLNKTTDTWCTYPTHKNVGGSSRCDHQGVRGVSIPENTETPNLLDEKSQKLGIWQPDDGDQDYDNKEGQGTSTAIKEEWHDANTQETTLRRDASDVEEPAPDDESTATRGVSENRRH